MIKFSEYLNEVALKKIKRVINNKLVKQEKCVNSDGSIAAGYKKEGNSCVKMSTSEIKTKSIASTKSQKMLNGKRNLINKKREKSMNKRSHI